jgi:hypothetical protein
MVQMAQAVAAGLGACNKDQLLHRLKYVLERVSTVPKHLQGELQYCSHCKQDLEDTLLVYFLVRDCRCEGVCEGGRGEETE